MNNAGDVEPTPKIAQMWGFRPELLVRRVRAAYGAVRIWPSRTPEHVVAELVVLRPERATSAANGHIHLPLYQPNIDGSTFLDVWIPWDRALGVEEPTDYPPSTGRLGEQQSEIVALNLLGACRADSTYVWHADDDNGLAPEWAQCNDGTDEGYLADLPWVTPSLYWLGMCPQDPWRNNPSLDNIKAYVSRWDHIAYVPPVEPIIPSRRRAIRRRP